MMKEYLEQFYIYYGGDMTTEAALSKLSYLLSKNLSRVEVKKQIETNLRGELTEIKK
jgi:L-asparaginase/Glu-tRNA(Gln) amidotransferase subunit D